MTVQDKLPEITTPRLRLRTPEAEDVTRIVALANDAEIARNTSGIPYPYTLDHGCAFIAMVRAANPEIDLPLLVEHAEHGPVGMVGLHRRDDPWPEIGYWLGRPYWGLGIATEAGAALVDWARAERGLKAIGSGFFADNPASGRVLEKLGFLHTGEVRKRLSYGRGVEAPTRMMIWLDS